MNTTTQSLTANAQKLLSFLKSTNGAWLGNCMDHLFDKPKYASNPDAQQVYWQWEANAYGGGQTRPVGQESVMFTQKIERNYSRLTSDAYQELKAAHLADESNNGYNEYWIYPVA